MYTIYRCVPLVWRSPGCVQFGADDPVLIDGLSPADADLLNLLRMGVSAAGLYDAAARCGVERTRAAALLALLDEAGVLVPVGPPALTGAPPGAEALAAHLHAAPARVAEALSARRVRVTGPLAEPLVAALLRAGLSAQAVGSAEEAAADPDALTVLTAVWAADLLGAGLLSEAGASHAHVVIGEGLARVEHPVVPGCTPCTGCRVGALSREDPGWLDAWRALRALRASAERADPALVALALALAAARLRSFLVAERLDPADVTIALDGSTTIAAPAFHPACDCRLPLAAPGAPAAHPAAREPLPVAAGPNRAGERAG